MGLRCAYAHIMFAATSENLPSGMCAQSRFRSACTFVQADQNLHWAHFELLKMQSFILRTTKLWSDFADAQADFSLRWAHMSEEMFFSRCLKYYNLFSGNKNI